MKKIDSIKIRLSCNDKKELLTYCQTHKTNASELIRKAIKLMIEKD